MSKRTMTGLVVALFALTLGFQPASAVNRTWTGGTSTDFSLDANWGGTAPADNLIDDIGVFSGALTANLPVLSADRSINGLDFQSAGWLLSGANTLSVGSGGISSAGVGTNTITAALDLGDAQSWLVGPANTLLVSSTISSVSPFSLTKTGSGTLYLTGQNTFGGSLAVGINGGTLQVRQDANLGDATNSIDFGTTGGLNGTLAVASSFAANRTVNMGTTFTPVDGTISVARDQMFYNAGTLSGGGTLNLTGLGTYAIAGAGDASYAGKIVISRNPIFSGATGAPASESMNAVSQFLLRDAGTLPSATMDQLNPLFAGAGAVTVGHGAQFMIDNRGPLALAAGPNLNRIDDSAGITLAGGTFNYQGSDLENSSETTGPLTLASGANTLTINRGSSASFYAELLINSPDGFLPGIDRVADSGATLNITTPSAGTLGGPGAGNVRITLLGTSPVANGIMPTWMHMGNDWVTSGGTGLAVYAGYTAVTSANNGSTWASANNIKWTGGAVTLAQDTTINSLVMTDVNGFDFAGPGFKLTLVAGGIIQTGNTRNFSVSTLTAGVADTDLTQDLTIYTNQVNTTTSYNLNMSSVITDNGTTLVRLVKDGLNPVQSDTLTLTGTSTYSGGTIVNTGTLDAGSAVPPGDGLTYLGAGQVVVRNGSTLILRTYGASSYNSLDVGGSGLPRYAAVGGATINLAGLKDYGTALDSFSIDNGSVLVGVNSGGTNGISGLTLSTATNGSFSLGSNVYAAPGAIIGHADGTTFGNDIAGGTAGRADLLYGIGANTAVSGTLNIGASTLYNGLSNDRSARTLVGLAGPAIISVAAQTGKAYDAVLEGAGNQNLTIGDGATTADTYSIVNTAGTGASFQTLRIGILGLVTLNESAADLSGVASMSVTDGGVLTLSADSALGGTGKEVPQLIVLPGGRLKVASSNALNSSVAMAVNVQSGGIIEPNLTSGGLTGNATINLDFGAVVDLTSSAGLAGGQLAVGPGRVVRLASSDVSGTQNIDGGAAFVVTGGNRSVSYGITLSANPGASGGFANGVLTNDGSSRTLSDVAKADGSAGPTLTIGAGGGTLAATVGTTLTVSAGIDLGANTLTIGADGLIDGNLKSLVAGQTITLNAGANVSTASGGTISVAGGATLLVGTSDTLPNSANLEVLTGGIVNLNSGSDIIGALTGAGTVTNTNTGTTRTLTIGGDTATSASGQFDGVLTATTLTRLNLAKLGSGVQTLTGVNLFTGTTAVYQGGLTLAGEDGQINSATTVYREGTLTLDNTTTPTLGSRLLGKTITLSGGKLTNVGDASELSSALTIASGTASVQVANGKTLTLGTITTPRTAGGSVVFSGTDLGTTTFMLFGGAAPATIGGALTGPSAAILPYALADTTAGGTGTGFATVDSGSIRRLNPGTELDPATTLTAGNNAAPASNASIAASMAVNSLTVADGVTVSGATGTQLTITSGGIMTTAAGSGSTISVPTLTTAANAEVVLWAMGTGNTTISSMIVGTTGGLQKNGPGAVTLTATLPQQYTGTTTINNGTLKLADLSGVAGKLASGVPGSINDLAAGNNMVMNGGTLDLNGTSQRVNGLTSANPYAVGTPGVITNTGSAATLTITGGGTFNGAFSGANLSVTKMGGGTLSGGVSDMGGAFNIRGSAPTLQNGFAFSSLTSLLIANTNMNLDNNQLANNNNRINDTADVTLYSGSLTLTGRGGTATSEQLGSAGHPVTLTGGLMSLTANAGTDGSAVLSIYDMTRTGRAGVNFSGTNLGTPGNNGRIMLLNANPLVAVSATDSTSPVVPWATVGTEWAAYDATTGVVPYAGYLTTMSGATSADNVSLGAGSITASPISTLKITGSQTLTGTLNLYGGGLMVTASSTISGGALTANNASTGDLVIYTSGSGTTLTMTTPIVTNGGGTLTLDKNGSGTLVLGGANIYTGATIVGQGTLNFASPTLGNIPGDLTLYASSTVNIQGPANIAATSNVTVANGSALNFQRSGATIQSLTMLNDAGGSAGVVVSTQYPAGNNSIDPAAPITITGHNAITVMHSVPTTVATLVSMVRLTDANPVITVNAAPELADQTALLVSGAIFGTNGFTKDGNGIMTLNSYCGGNSGYTAPNANNYSGTTTILNGMLDIGNNNMMSDVSGVSIAPGAYLRMNNRSDIIGSLSGAGTVLTNGTSSQILTLGGDNFAGSRDFSGTIVDQTIPTFAASSALYSRATINKIGTSNGDQAFSGTGSLASWIGPMNIYNGSVTLSGAANTMGPAPADLAIDAVDATKVTSASFNTSSVGATLVITGGTGFTAATYTISAVNGNVATLNAAAGTVGSTGGTGAIAGAGNNGLVQVFSGGALVLDNTTENVNNRLNQRALTLAGGSLVLYGNALADSSETSPFTLTMNHLEATVRIIPGANHAATVTVASLSRGSYSDTGVLKIAGPNLGVDPTTAGGFAEGVANFKIANQGATGVQTGGQPATMSLVSGIFIDNSATGGGGSFAAYTTALGVRPLLDSEYTNVLRTVIGGTTYTTFNVKASSTLTLPTGTTGIYSLTMAGGDINSPNNAVPQNLSVRRIMATASGTINANIDSYTDGGFTGNGDTYIYVLGDSTNLTVNGMLASWGSPSNLYKGGSGTLTLTKAAQLFGGQGSIDIAEGKVVLAANSGQNQIGLEHEIRVQMGAGATLDLNGNNQVLSALYTNATAMGNPPTITSSLPATLNVSNEVFNGTSQTFDGLIRGALSFTKSQNANLVLDGGVSDFSGSFKVLGATVTLQDAARITNTSDVTISDSALTLENNGVNTGLGANADRLKDTAPISMFGGTLNLNGRGGLSVAETVGAVTLNGGMSTLASNPNMNSTYRPTGSTVLTLSGLTQGNTAATVVFSNPSNSGALGFFGTTGYQGGGFASTFITGQAAGLIGPWATVNSWTADSSNSATYDWASNNNTDGSGTSNGMGVQPFAGYTTLTGSNWGDAVQGRITGSALTMNASQSLASLKLSNNIDIGGTAPGNILTLRGVPVGTVGPTAVQIAGILADASRTINATNAGSITVAPVGGAGDFGSSELILNSAGGNITVATNATFTDFDATHPLTLVKTGGNTLTINSDNSIAAGFTGGMVVNGGTLTFAAGAKIKGPLTINGGTNSTTTVTLASATNLVGTADVTINGLGYLNAGANAQAFGTITMNDIGGGYNTTYGPRVNSSVAMTVNNIVATRYFGSTIYDTSARDRGYSGSFPQFGPAWDLGSTSHDITVNQAPGLEGQMNISGINFMSTLNSTTGATINKKGPGTMYLDVSNAASLTNATWNILDGTVNANNGPNGLGSSAVLVNLGATDGTTAGAVRIQGGGTIAQTINLNSGGGILETVNGNLTANGLIQLADGVTSATLTVRGQTVPAINGWYSVYLNNAADNYTSLKLVDGGIARVDTVQNFGSDTAGSSFITIQNGGRLFNNTLVDAVLSNTGLVLAGGRAQFDDGTGANGRDFLFGGTNTLTADTQVQIQGNTGYNVRNLTLTNGISGAFALDVSGVNAAFNVGGPMSVASFSDGGVRATLNGQLTVTHLATLGQNTVSVTNLNVNALTLNQVTSASIDSTLVGADLVITGGTNMLPGTYKIVSVTGTTATLDAAAATGASTNGAGNWDSGGTVINYAGTSTVGGLSGNGNIVLAPSAILAVGGDSSSSIFSGRFIGGNGTLNKVTNGSLTLTNTSTLGAINVQGGTLVLNAPQNAALSVTNGTLSLGVANALGGNPAPFTLGAAGVLQLNNTNQNIGVLGGVAGSKVFFGSDQASSLDSATTATLTTVSSSTGITNFSGGGTLPGPIYGGLIGGVNTTFDKNDTGLLILNASQDGFFGTFKLSNGVLRNADLYLPNATFVLAGGASEITTNLTSTLGSGIGQINLTGGGGFVALDEDVSINFNGNSPADTLVWGSTPYFVGDGKKLTIGVSPASTAASSVTVLNTIDLNGAVREINVLSSSSLPGNIDAILAERLIDSAIGGGGGLNKTGPGTLLLDPLSPATYTGPTIVSNGTLTLDADGALPAGSTLTVNAPGVLDVNGLTTALGTLNGNGSVVLGPSLSVGVVTFGSDDASGSFSGVISGGGSIIKAGAGVQTLSGPNSYNGSTSIVNGTLQLGAASRLPSGTALTVTAPGVFDMNNFNQTLGSIGGTGTVTMGTAALTVGGDNSNSTFSGSLSGSGSISKLGTGTMTLDMLGANNTFSGQYLLSTGALQGVLQGDFSNPFGSGTVSLSGRAALGIQGNLTGGFLTMAATYSGDNTVFVDKTVAGGATLLNLTLTPVGNATVIFQGSQGELGSNEQIVLATMPTPANGIVDATMLARNGTGSAVDFATVSGGSMAAFNSYVSGLGASTLATDVVEAQALDTVAGSQTIYALKTAVSIGGTGTLTIGDGAAAALIANDTLTISPAINFGAAQGRIYVASSKVATLSGNLTSTGGFFKSGPGNLLLSGAASAVSGPVVISDGSVVAGAANVLSGASLNISSLGAFDMNGFNQQVLSLAGVGSVTSATPATLSFTGGANVTVPNAITGAVNVTMNGTGTLRLNNLNNTFNGGLVINNGAVRLQAGDTLGTGVVTVNNGSTNWANGLQIYADLPVANRPSEIVVNTNGLIKMNFTGSFTAPITLNGGTLWGGQDSGNFYHTILNATLTLAADSKIVQTGRGGSGSGGGIHNLVLAGPIVGPGKLTVAHADFYPRDYNTGDGGLAFANGTSNYSGGTDIYGPIHLLASSADSTHGPLGTGAVNLYYIPVNTLSPAGALNNDKGNNSGIYGTIVSDANGSLDSVSSVTFHYGSAWDDRSAENVAPITMMAGSALVQGGSTKPAINFWNGTTGNVHLSYGMILDTPTLSQTSNLADALASTILPGDGLYGFYNGRTVAGTEAGTFYVGTDSGTQFRGIAATPTVGFAYTSGFNFAGSLIEGNQATPGVFSGAEGISLYAGTVEGAFNIGGATIQTAGTNHIKFYGPSDFSFTAPSTFLNGAGDPATLDYYAEGVLHMPASGVFNAGTLNMNSGSLRLSQVQGYDLVGSGSAIGGTAAVNFNSGSNFLLERNLSASTAVFTFNNRSALTIDRYSRVAAAASSLVFNAGSQVVYSPIDGTQGGGVSGLTDLAISTVDDTKVVSTGLNANQVGFGLVVSGGAGFTPGAYVITAAVSGANLSASHPISIDAVDPTLVTSDRITTAMVGTTLVIADTPANITAGFTPGNYTITAVTGNTATLDAAAGTPGSVTGTGNTLAMATLAASPGSAGSTAGTGGAYAYYGSVDPTGVASAVIYGSGNNPTIQLAGVVLGSGSRLTGGGSPYGDTTYNYFMAGEAITLASGQHSTLFAAPNGRTLSVSNNVGFTASDTLNIGDPGTFDVVKQQEIDLYTSYGGPNGFQTITQNGTVQLNGVGTQGVTNVVAGTLAINNAAAVGDASAMVNLGTGATTGDVAVNLMTAGPIPASFTVAAGTGNRTINSGDSTISGGLTLNKDVTVNVATGTTLTQAGTVNGNGGAMVKTGNGLFALAAPGNYTAPTNLNVNQGAVELAADQGPVNANLTVNVNNTSALHVSSVGAQHVAALNVNDTSTTDLVAGGNKVLVTGALTMPGLSSASTTAPKLDIVDNKMVIQYAGASPMGQGSATGVDAATGLTKMLLAAELANFGGAPVVGLGSSAADVNNNGKIAAAVDTSGLTSVDSSVTTWGGVPVAANQVLVGEMYVGDLDFNGTIDGTDFTIIASAFDAQQQGDLDPTTMLYQYGDLDMSGVVDGTDFTIMASIYDFVAGGGLVVGGQSAGQALNVQPVPEPATLSLLVLGGVVGLAARTIRRRRHVA